MQVFEDLERYFGPTFEIQSHEKYTEIRDLDEKYPFLKPEGGDSVADFVSRLTSALVQIKSEFQGCEILIVSHGDPLQILQIILNAVCEQVVPDGGDLARQSKLHQFYYNTESTRC